MRLSLHWHRARAVRAGWLALAAHRLLQVQLLLLLLLLRLLLHRNWPVVRSRLALCRMH